MKTMVLLLLGLVLITGCQSLPTNENLSRASIAGDIQTVKELVKSGENVNGIDKWGWTALLWSVYYGNITVSKWLLEQGADPNIKTEKDYGSFLSGTTALILAASYNHPEALAALLNKNADASYVDKKGRMAIDYAREYGFDQSVALLQKKQK